MPDWKLQPQLVCRLKPREEGCDIAAEPLGLLDRGEVPSARHRGPPAHVVQALGPLAGRRSIVDLQNAADRGGPPAPGAGSGDALLPIGALRPRRAAPARQARDSLHDVVEE